VTAEAPIPVVAAGFGRWTQSRTLGALIDSGHNLNVVAVTALRDGQREFESAVVPFFASRTLPLPRYADTLASALAYVDGQTPAVVISTPNGLHGRLAREALAGGAHVYVEKPPATPADDLPSLVELALNQNLHYHTGSQRRLEKPYRYIHEAVSGRRDFGELRSIRCVLAAGERLEQWRADKPLSGGGVLIDSGYHLLDAAAHLISAVTPSWRATDGSVYVGGGHNEASSGIETTAYGWLSGDDITLFFDLSYEAPRNSVFERLEVRDQDGSRIALTRSQSLRSRSPGTILHQRGAGELVTASDGEFDFAIDDIPIASEPDEAKPLAEFLDAASSDLRPSESTPCSCASALPTWHLLQDIERFTNSNRKG
jgi:predicted dehydrogenase